MKTTSQGFLSPLSTQEKLELAQTPAETLAPEALTSKYKTFNSLDLWSVHKKYRSSVSRRRFL